MPSAQQAGSAAHWRGSESCIADLARYVQRAVRAAATATPSLQCSALLCSPVSPLRLIGAGRSANSVGTLVMARAPQRAGRGRAGHTEKIQSQNLGQPNPETKGTKIKKFGGPFDSYTKIYRKRLNGFLNRSQNGP